MKMKRRLNLLNLWVVVMLGIMIAWIFVKVFNANLQVKLDYLTYQLKELQHENLELRLEIRELRSQTNFDKKLDDKFNKLNSTSEVRFTSYWIDDPLGSHGCTSSGLCYEDFVINENGWYEYDNKVVVAGATDICLNAQSGPCGKYNELPSGYNLHKLYDEIVIEVNGVKYDAIILDSCGASFWNESHQRYDIFVANAESAETSYGLVHHNGGK